MSGISISISVLLRLSQRSTCRECRSAFLFYYVLHSVLHVRNVDQHSCFVMSFTVSYMSEISISIPVLVSPSQRPTCHESRSSFLFLLNPAQRPTCRNLDQHYCFSKSFTASYMSRISIIIPVLLSPGQRPTCQESRSAFLL